MSRIALLETFYALELKQQFDHIMRGATDHAVSRDASQSRAWQSLPP
jgi:hypothetical protein